jgi:hypothetical protein
MRNASTGGSGWNRRQVLGGIGGGLTLSLTPLGGSISDNFINSVRAGDAAIDYSGWEDLYRKEWAWDGAFWGSHNNQCWPANCLFRVYTRNGVIWREEQAAKAPPATKTILISIRSAARRVAASITHSRASNACVIP